MIALIARSRVGVFAVAGTLLAAGFGFISVRSAEALTVTYCSGYVVANHKCPEWGNAERHSWTYNEVWQYDDTQGIGTTTCEQAFRDYNGYLLSQRCFNGNGYVDSQSDLTGQYLSNAYAWNYDGLTRWMNAQAHT
jgi:hypothetical protein